jgi:hypothetical protein
VEQQPPQGAPDLTVAHCTYPTPGSTPTIDVIRHNGAHATASRYHEAYRARIFRFDARRLPGHECGPSESAVLDSQATRLPFCINHLASHDRHGHEQLCAWVNRIFPEVGWIQAPPVNTNIFRLYCLPGRKESRRDDLMVPIARMGTGIGNVLAILYVVLTSRVPHAIVVDELNAFLHPKAIRELFAILEAEAGMHQFIVTAHSADVLTAVRPSTVALISRSEERSIVKQVDSTELHTLRGELAELGIRLTDLHAKDRVLWVEGQTEETVMGDLLKFACPEIAAGTAVLRVERTGTFKKKGMNPSEVAAIYERLSTASALVPPMICILLDGDTYKLETRSKLEEESRGKLRFLERLMLENYLLDADAITAALHDLGEHSISRDAVKARLPEATSDMSHIDGASLLSSVFSDLSDAKQEFSKTRDVPVILDWLLANRPTHLDPLRERLRKKLLQTV